MSNNFPLHAVSRDHSSVRWDGELYTFTRQQALIVAYLIQEFEIGAQWCHYRTILDAVDSNAERLRDVFPSNDAWGTLIIASDERQGLYGIATPKAQFDGVTKNPPFTHGDICENFEYNSASQATESSR